MSLLTVLNAGWGAMGSLLPIVVAGIYGGDMSVVGQMTMGGVLSLVNLSNNMAWPLNSLGTYFNEISRKRAALERVMAILHEPAESDPVTADQARNVEAETPEGRPAVEVNCLSFQYEEGRPVLQDVSLRVERGAFACIVGKSGCGKSTLLKMFTDAMTARDVIGIVTSGRWMILLALVFGMGSSIGSYALGRFSERASWYLRAKILGRALRAPLPYLESRPGVHVVSCLINNVESIEQVFSAFQDLAANVVLVGASIVNIFVWSWPVAITVIVLALLCGLLSGVFAGRLKKVSDTYQGNLARITETATAIFTGIPVIKSLEKEEFLAGKFGAVSKDQYDLGTVRGKILALQASVSRLAPEMSTVCLLLVTGVMTMTGRITPGQAVALVQLASFIVFPHGLSGREVDKPATVPGGSR